MIPKKLTIEEKIGLAQDALDNPGKYDCMAGISLGTSKYSQKSNRELYINFLSEYFNKIMLFINDYNYHWDIMAFQNKNKEEALDKAKRMGKELENGYKKTIRGYLPEDERDRIKILRFFDLKKDKRYHDFEKKFYHILEQNKNIEDEIEKDLEKQVRNTEYVKEKLSNNKRKRTEEFAKNYVRDQLVSNLYLMFNLSNKEYPIRISLTPYSQYISLKKCLRGDYGDLKKDLSILNEFGVISGINF